MPLEGQNIKAKLVTINMILSALSISAYHLLITKNSTSFGLHLKGTRFINILNFKEKKIII